MQITPQIADIQAISLNSVQWQPSSGAPVFAWYLSQIKPRTAACDYCLSVTDYISGAVMLTEDQLLEFKMQLKERFCDVREEIRLELIRSDDQHFIDLAGQVHDLEDESVADLLVDLNLAMIDMHVEEIRAIDASLMSIAQGGYGVCIDCGIDISVERLFANLTAKRCTPCQSAYERNHAGPQSHTL